MEEDIEIIQEMLRLNKKRIEPQIVQAIENLINKCKELRQELVKYEMQAGKLNQNMVSALEEAFKYSLEIKDLEKQNKEQEKMIELMAEFYAKGNTIRGTKEQIIECFVEEVKKELGEKYK